MTKFRSFTRTTLWILLGLGMLPVLVGAAAFLYLSPNLPSVDVLKDVQLQTPLRVYTSDGELIGEFGEMRRTPIQLSNLPPLFIKSVLAAEDDSFYTHHGVDIKSLMRAGSQLLTSGHIQTGGSTITMQVAKNFFLTPERSFARKFNEILLALQIEHELSKEEILELYLNKIFLGNRAYGVEAAAQVYYGKSISELSIAQWAVIAGLPKAPSANNPISNPERALQRRNWILGRMHSLGYISQQQYDTALNEPLNASIHGSVLGVEASYAAEMVRQEMVERFGLKAYTDGYVAYTTLDSKLQHTATRAIVDGLLSYDARHGFRGAERKLKPAADGNNRAAWQRVLAATPELGGLTPAAVLGVDAKSITALLASNATVTIDWEHGLSRARRLIDEDHRGPSPQSAADVVAVGDLIRLRQNTKGEWELSQVPALQSAIVSINADDGAIRSLVGGFDFHQSKFNRITQAQRQPGSGFKPFIYTAALENGLTPATIMNDAPIVYQEAGMEEAWRPENDTGEFYGPTPLRQALYKSRNVVSVRVLQRIGVDTVIDYVPRFGFEKNQLPRNLSIALGTLSATPMQMVRGFAVFANTGYLIEPYLLQRVTDRNGAIAYEAKPVLACPNCDQAPSATMGDTNITEPQTADSSAASTNTTTASDAPAPQGPLAPQVLDKRYGFIMDSMLRDVVQRGTATAARVLGRSDMAGKTGTTSGPVDTWFNGYASGIVTTVWAGFDSNKPMGKDEYGATVALPIWIEYMRAALAGKPEHPFKQPQGVVSLRIDPHTGLQASPDQPDAVFEYFTEDHLPGEEGPGAAPAESTAPAPASGVSEHDLF